jgi:hypothetical protein
LPCRPVTRPQGGKLPHLPPPARGRLSHRSWGRRLLTTRALLLRHGEQLTAGRPHHPLPTQGWTFPRALLMLEKLPLGTSGRRPPRRLLTSAPSVLCLVELTTWSVTSLRSTWRPEVQKHLAHRYLHIHLRVQGCHGAQLVGITPLGRRTGLKTTRTCRPCEPASSPSTPR